MRKKRVTRADRERACHGDRHCQHDLGNNRRVCCVCGRMEVHVEVAVKQEGHGRFAPPESLSRWEHVGYASPQIFRRAREGG